MHICRWGALRPPPAKCILSGACFITMWALSLAAVYLSITHIRMNRVRRLPRTNPNFAVSVISHQPVEKGDCCDVETADVDYCGVYYWYRIGIDADLGV
jgi:hypothetical protein